MIGLQYLKKTKSNFYNSDDPFLVLSKLRYTTRTTDSQ